MTQPVSKASGYFDLICNYITNKQKFNDLEFRRFLFDVEKVDSFVSKNELTGFAHAIQGNKEEALSCYKNALASSLAGFNTKGNYYILLKYFGLHREAYEYGKTISYNCSDHVFLNDFFLENVIALDVECAERTFEKLRGMNKLDQKEVTMEASKEMDLMKRVSEHFINKDQLLMISDAALKAAEEHHCKLIGNRITHNKESNHLSVSYVLDCEEHTSDEAFDVNMSLIDNLIRMNLDTLPAVVQFVRLSRSQMPEKEVILKAEEETNVSQS
ncbi:hypothetical protein Sbal195_0754 [Shewanella baltica OS195]|uniref:Uncharacterized protein n=1 Tax=Shewanella baltica (strain OS195) TaxID=399599 RepID=A9L133_SHEB9|nr:hypothetical protein [Shewanella baltica]ABX47932.1 hypothetical protein Sbal195_0754 [Shewanella baltica OS195]